MELQIYTEGCYSEIILHKVFNSVQKKNNVLGSAAEMDKTYEITGKLWDHLCTLVKNDTTAAVKEHYIPAVRGICKKAAELSQTIRDTFPLYTLHNETHINNVLHIMAELLGEEGVNGLSRDMTAMLILSAFCHDIGMSYTNEEKEEIFSDEEQIAGFLNANLSEYVKAYKHGTFSELSDAAKLKLLRSLHHERVEQQLNKMNWPDILVDNVPREDLAKICKSHNLDAESLISLSSTGYNIDLPLCGVLLRLADILDLDDTRAPKTLYNYTKFDKNRPDDVYSEDEWKKHLASRGFHFDKVKDRSVPYELPFSASSPSINVEMSIRDYLSWVDEEFRCCDRVLKKLKISFVLPYRVDPIFRDSPYEASSYCLSLDHKKVLELLSGEDLYSDPAVFVRELIQNAIDAVRTREKLDKNLPRGWKPKITIHTWIDEDGYNWFRIEDNGIGMTKEHIKNNLLKIGCSYYTSDAFERDKIQAKIDDDFCPISHFGIGILSCFMGDNQNNLLEISTKHYSPKSPALRLRMQGIEGYYYLADKSNSLHCPGEMPGRDQEEKKPYRNDAGTVVALRTNLFQMGGYLSFKKIVDRYVIYPPIPIEYRDDECSFTYTTEQEFMWAMHAIAPHSNPLKAGEFEFDITKQVEEYLRQNNINLTIVKPFTLFLKIMALDRYTESRYLSGVILVSKVEGEFGKVANGIFEPSLHYYQQDDTIGFSIHKKENEYSLDSKSLGISCSVCNLLDFDWYKKFFRNVLPHFYRQSFIAHNGVFCGEGIFLIDSMFSLPSIILLKDKYRPVVGISRNEVREMPLEVLCDMATIWRIAHEQNYLETHVTGRVKIAKPYEPTFACIKTFLEKRRDIEEKIIIKTNKGNFKICELSEKLDEISELYILEIGWIQENINCPVNPDEIYQLMIRYYLQDRFLLRVRKTWLSDYKIYIIGSRNGHNEQGYSVFPPSFFIQPYDNQFDYIRYRNIQKIYALNSNHRLSRFLIKNGVYIKKYAPGIFSKLISLLAHGIGPELPSEINKQLKYLRRLIIEGHENYFNIDDKLLLTEKDFD